MSKNGSNNTNNEDNMSNDDNSNDDNSNDSGSSIDLKKDFTWLIPVIVIIIIIAILWAWKKWANHGSQSDLNLTNKTEAKFSNKNDNLDNKFQKEQISIDEKLSNQRKNGEFVFTQQIKTENHANWNRGHSLGFTINGVEGATLNLRRNKSYKFIYSPNNDDTINSQKQKNRIYFTTSEIGKDLKSQIQISPIFDQDKSPTHILIFNDQYPNKFYYQSIENEYMGGIINLS